MFHSLFSYFCILIPCFSYFSIFNSSFYDRITTVVLQTGHVTSIRPFPFGTRIILPHFLHRNTLCVFRHCHFVFIYWTYRRNTAFSLLLAVVFLDNIRNSAYKRNAVLHQFTACFPVNRYITYMTSPAATSACDKESAPFLPIINDSNFCLNLFIESPSISTKHHQEESVLPNLPDFVSSDGVPPPVSL